jgi:hypothetical protein
MTNVERDHWDALRALVAEVKKDRDGLGKILREGTPTQVSEALEGRGIDMKVLGAIFTDLELIADRSSIRWWSPLAS